MKCEHEVWTSKSNTVVYMANKDAGFDRNYVQVFETAEQVDKLIAELRQARDLVWTPDADVERPLGVFGWHGH